MSLMPQWWHDEIARTKESATRKAAGEKRYWYFVYSDYCPVCGHNEDTRERIYGERPEKWEDRHKDVESYDGCEGY